MQAGKEKNLLSPKTFRCSVCGFDLSLTHASPRLPDNISTHFFSPLLAQLCFLQHLHSLVFTSLLAHFCFLTTFPLTFFHSCWSMIRVPYECLPPPGFFIAESRLPGAGLGVFTNRSWSENIRMGEYLGEFVHADADATHNPLLFEVKCQGQVTYNIDASNPRHSNWTRYQRAFFF